MSKKKDKKEQKDIDVQEVNKQESKEISHKEQIQQELQQEKDKFLRLFAEFENYKKRTSREKIELFTTANQELMTVLLPVLDDFERASNEIKKANEENNEFLKGIELIINKLRNSLAQKGLNAIDTNKGDVFDVELHEAITQIDAPSEDLQGKIIDVVEKGYKLGEKIIRYPKVVVGK